MDGGGVSPESADGDGADELAARITRVRAFNRFYTSRIGVLAEGLHDGPFSLTEVRVMYEIAERRGVTAAALARDLRLDPAYLSRIVKKFRAAKLIEAAPDLRDRRERTLSLTDAGREALAPLVAASNRQMGGMLSAFDESRQLALVAAMDTLEEILGDDGRNRGGRGAEPWLIRSHRPGDIGWIVHRHGVLYTRDHGFNGFFEGFVAEIAGKFGQEHDPAREHLWVAERRGEIVGSVMLVRQDDRVAKLRLLYVEPDARGSGIGRRLLAQCLRFARDARYAEVTLWTNDVLRSARKLYEGAGFRLVDENPHRMFGPPMVGQTWTLTL